MNLLAWNINQRSNYNKKGSEKGIPSFVGTRIRDSKADIVILSEYKRVNGWEEFENTLESNAYNVFVTENQHNDVLLAIKKEHPILEGSKHTWNSSYSDNMPDYMEVSIEYKQKNITVIGARILVDCYEYPIGVPNEMKNRHMQWAKISGRIERLHQKGNLVIGAGDFNTGRRENRNEDWSMGALKRELALMDTQLYTPDDYSHELYKGKYAGCPDHLFATNSIIVTTPLYDTDFMEENKSIYSHFAQCIPNPYPDHAILTAEVDILD